MFWANLVASVLLKSPNGALPQVIVGSRWTITTEAISKIGYVVLNSQNGGIPQLH
jgi:hypothetical protein